jgi:adenylylsulfate kinase-like enzyme
VTREDLILASASEPSGLSGLGRADLAFSVARELENYATDVSLTDAENCRAGGC